jgi:hypothetical protein
MKQPNTQHLIVPIVRHVAVQISPFVNNNLSDDDYFQSFRHITKFIQTLKLDVDEFKIIEATIRMATFEYLLDYGHDYAVNDIEEWLLLNSNNFITGKVLNK